MSEKDLSKGWSVTFCGMGINLALGILYAWSVIKGAFLTHGDGAMRTRRFPIRSPAWSLRLPWYRRAGFRTK